MTPDEAIKALASNVKYSPGTGEFIWLPRARDQFATAHAFEVWNKRFAGKKAGRIDGHGYVSISFRGKKVKGHRLAYLIARGEAPDNIDHVNGVRSDNRIENLRPATHSENGFNKSVSSRSKSGVKGVFWHKKAGRWHSQIRSNGVVRHLGLFDSIEEAKAARDKASLEMHGQFSFDGDRSAT